ncbi:MULTISPECIES: AAA family ATPase [Pseudomonas]|uniref:ATP-dependent DNA helicase n=1 Tax=Pseudomonas TaxID=286 RepID=UPI001AE6C396|nr:MULTISPECIES: AAA family ATPase [Pseudomonas]MBP2085807.1 tRNA A37 threonylcarbamoyladenosine biosynthesis protein TsaE [Pseudomonas sp. PvP089]MBP2088491.1 tRNA A37 threonylcarbamoyladenosine biosynthesis protein TsaE [Pseudomonas sp. PvP088]MBP2225189.1 tRNA A37 threonylcarbamoyladenosine biosynthesis protein TsaE [Pseudomonas putida]
MVSDNFAPLKSRWPELYMHASLAERYVFADPHTAVIKLRCFAEVLVGVLYRDLSLPSEPSDGFFEKLKYPAFQEVVGDIVLQKLHALRMIGNKAAHGSLIDASISLALIWDAYLIGQWFFKTYSGESADTYPPFTAPVEASEQGGPAEDPAEQLALAKDELSGLEAAEKDSQAVAASITPTPDQARLDDFKCASAHALGSIDFSAANTRRHLSIHDAFAGYTLTSGQTELVNQLEHFLASNTQNVFLLKGYAGTGKTFITKGLTEYFRAIGRNYVLAAPTGKAAKVIASKTQSPAYTLHKTLYAFDDMDEYRDADTEGSETFKFYAKLAVNTLSVDTVYIVDEASMVADIYQEAEFFRFGSGYLLADLFEFVNPDHNDHRKKVIFIGDDAQLPPVGMSFSPALDAEYLLRHHRVRCSEYELSEVVRQKAQSGILANAQPLRQSLQSKVFNRLTMDLSYPDVEKVEHQALLQRYLDSCGGKINGESIVIAHSNADVGDYNRLIREHFFPGCAQVMPGDKVMAVANSNAHGFFISNGDFGLIREVLGEVEERSVKLRRRNPETAVVEEIVVPLRFRDVLAGFRDLDGTAHFFPAKIIEDLLYSKEPTLSSDENKALYLDFCMRHKHLPRRTKAFKDALMADPYFNALRLKFGYAITCHKAQGSEWNHVFVKCKSHQSQLTADYFRWLYTAITRTAHHLYLLDPPNHQPWSGIQMVANPALEMLGAAPSMPAAPVPAPSVAAPAFAAVAPAPQDETFGIPASATVLLALLTEVRRLIAGRGISIEDVLHHQYQEVYLFSRDGESARIDIAYNGKSKITGVAAPYLSELSGELSAVLAALKGLPLADGGTAGVADVHFAKPFLNEFHAKVLNLCADSGITLQKVVEQQWCQRYSFTRDGAVAVYDIWYNGKDQFTKCQPVVAACSPGTMVAEVGQLLTAGMQA